MGASRPGLIGPAGHRPTYAPAAGRVPEPTARVTFPRGNHYLRLRDQLRPVFRDSHFAGPYPGRGQPALPPWMLAPVTVMPFAEDFRDRRAADAGRGRIDSKYTLGLEGDELGFAFSILSEFCGHLAAGGAERLLLDRMLEAARTAACSRPGPAGAPTRLRS